MLYEWLAETDERRFDQAFSRYYAEASTQVVRYLARRSSLPDADCEQIALDALMKFFGCIGRDRRQAAGVVDAALPGIKPINLGIFHGVQIQRWTADVAVFRQTSMGFVPPAAATDHGLKPLIQAINDNIPGLRRQGCLVLDGVRTHTAEQPAVGTDSVIDDEARADDSDSLPHYYALRQFALAMRTQHDCRLDAESHRPGVFSVVDGTWTVIETLPLLRVPTNGFLFDIAHSLYLDECKARGRRKRGGSGYSTADTRADLMGGGAPNSPNPLTLDEEEWPDDAEEGAWGPLYASAGGTFALPADDSSLAQIDEDFCEQFYTFLRRPLTDAEEAYRRAAQSGRAEAERKRLESIGRKNERLMTILTMRVEGHTQEAIAESMGISRNQVKYIVELVQASYDEFCAATTRTRRA